MPEAKDPTGKEIARDRIATAGKAAGLTLTAEGEGLQPATTSVSTEK